MDANSNTLATRLIQTWSEITVATQRFLTYLREFDEQRLWADAGAKSCADWLNIMIGISLGAAREKVRVANALGRLPAVDAALAKGRISYSKARAVTRVAVPENQELLVTIAEETTAAQLEKTVRLYDQTRAVEQCTKEPERWVNAVPHANGMVRIEIQLLPEEAETVMNAIEAAAPSRKAAERPEGLLTLADSAVRDDKTGKPAVETVVHIDAETLEGHLENDTAIAKQTCRRLLCDSGLITMSEKYQPDSRGDVLNVGRKTRTIPPALRRALQVRDRGCQFPGCSQRKFVDGHHLVHWADGGDTKLDNLTLLCRYHHTFVHERGYRVQLDQGGAMQFFKPNGQVVKLGRSAVGDDVEVPTPHPWLGELAGKDVDQLMPIGDGQPIQYPFVVEAICDETAEPDGRSC